MTNSNPGTEVTLTRRRLLGGLAATGVAAAGAGAGTLAYFIDTESSTDNTVMAGTLDLKLDGQDGTSGSFSVSGLVPGYYGSGSMEVTNAGTTSADHVEMRFSATSTEASGGNGTNDGDTAPSSADGMATVFHFRSLTYDGTDLIADRNVTDDNGNGIVDLADIVTHGVFDDLAPPAGTGATLGFEAGIVDTEGGTYTGTYDDDDFQGDELTVTVEFAMAQDSGQDLL